MGSTRVTFGFDALPVSAANKMGLAFRFQSNPIQIVVRPCPVPPNTEVDGLKLGDGLVQLGKLLGIDALSQLGKLPIPPPWSHLFNARILPSFTLEPVGQNPSATLQLQLYEDGQPHDSGIEIGGSFGPITIEPDMVIYDLVIGYVKGSGVDLKARVLFKDNESKDKEKSGGKTQLISYPFPLPDQNESASFKLKFLGLGQRFAPKTIDLNAPDPLADAFDKLEKAFASDDPKDVINTLVKDYYRPDAGWFFALDLDVRGFTVRAVLADPVLYGLEVTCSSGPFTGLLAEILYQKLGADLGVFYGKIVLPDNIRNIQLGALSVTIPSIQIWIYTNGDFKVAIGWPLGPDSFGLQVYIFTGEAGFYFGKLRSGDNPTGRTADQTNYDPILVFGLALKIGVGRSFSKGPISAEASLTLQGVFQGLLAWKSTTQHQALLPALAPNQAAAAADGGIARTPDYYWFSASVTLAGVVQGSVDLAIISATICIEVWATVATAFETDCNTEVHAEIGVRVEVSIRILFVTIHIHFNATLDLSFTLIGGHAKTASVEGPQDPSLRAFIPTGPAASPAMALRFPRLDLAGAQTSTINLDFILQPTVVYDGKGAGTPSAVATLLIPCPDATLAEPPEGSDFETLADAISAWLLDAYGGSDKTWKSVAAELGGGGQNAPPNFETGLLATLARLTFVVTGVDLTKPQKQNLVAAIFPMFDPLVIENPTHEKWEFGKDPLTWSQYPEALKKYFAALSALTPKPPQERRRAAARAEPAGPSLSHLLLVNWFLAMARQIASAMADAEKSHGGSLPAGTMPTPKTLATVASMMSRMALHGARLPDPAIIHGPNDPITEKVIHPIYALDHQQFAGATSGSIQGTLTVAGGSSLNITFAAGASAVALLPGAAAPSQPSPKWSKGGGGANGIAVMPVPPLSVGALRIAVTARTQAAGVVFKAATPPANAYILVLPPEATPYVRSGGVSATLLTKPNGGPPPPTTIPSAGGLLVPLSLRRVAIDVGADLTQSSDGQGLAPTDRWCKDVYEMVGTDDDTRALLEHAIDDGNVRRIVPLFFKNNQLETLDSGTQPVCLFKANVSTTSQPNALFTPQLWSRRKAEAFGQDLGPVVAPLGNVQNFLDLVWECSVVHTGGFYLRYSDKTGQGLDPSLFDKDVARFWLWLDQGDATDSPTLARSCNSLVIEDAGNDSKATAYLALKRGQVEITTYQPSFPPGFVGAELVWTSPPAPDPSPYSAASVAALYHMIELQIAGTSGKYQETLWSTGLSAISQDPPPGNGEAIRSLTYRQVVPAWRYLQGQSTTPYAAVGSPAPLAFRLSDVYGNVLSDPKSQFQLEFPVLYNDPLLSPAMWPGCAVTYAITKTAGKARLGIAISFDPASLESHAAELRKLATAGDPAADALKAAQATWTTIVQQVGDPNCGLMVTSTLYGDAAKSGVWPPLGDPASALAQLRVAADAINASIQSEPPKPCSKSIEFDLDLAKIAARNSDIFALGVRITLSRQGVDPAVSDLLPAVATITSELPPRLPGNSSSSNDEPSPPFVAWARAVEDALAGFDGQAGRIKVAQRPVSSESASSSVANVWAVRFSPTAGISIKRQALSPATMPVFYTMQPFSRTLQFGKIDVTVYDADLNGKTITTSPASVDADVLAQFFLTSFDRILAPDLGAGIARNAGSANPDLYTQLMGYKAIVASVLKDRLIKVFEDRPDGDLAAAKSQFEQSLLSKLSNAYVTAAVIQVPVELRIAGIPEGGANMPPRLFGGFTPPPGQSTSTKAPPYSLSSPKLSLDGSGELQRWLTFQATVKSPTAQTTLDLTPTWTISHIEHLLEPSPAQFGHGYVSSGWLKFVVPDQDAASPLMVALTPDPEHPIGVPVPFRQYPLLPALQEQKAGVLAPSRRFLASEDPIQKLIEEHLKWDYQLSLKKLEKVAQDELWVTATFNHALDWQPEHIDALGPLTPLTEALLRFRFAFESLAPALPLLNGTDAKAQKLAGLLVTIVGDVIANLRPLKAFFAPPPVERLIWVLDYADAYKDKKLKVFGKADSPSGQTKLVFPKISAQSPSTQPVDTPPADAPDGKSGWKDVFYDYPDGVPDSLAIEVDGLNLLAQQTVIGSTKIVRNANLGSKVNPLLVYETPELSFANVLVPYVDVVRPLGPVTGTSLAQIIDSILTPLTAAGSAVGSDRLVRLSAAFNYPVVNGAPGALMAKLPALLNAGQPLGDDPQALATAFADGLAKWYGDVKLPTQGAFFSFTVSLFINLMSGGSRQVPLVTFEDIAVALPPGWPPSK